MLIHKSVLMSAVTGIVLASSSISQAALLAYEGFNYTNGSGLNNVSSGGTGFGTNSWLHSGSNAPTVGAGLSLGNLQVSGGAAVMTGRGDQGTNILTRTVGTPATTGTNLYFSFLHRRDTWKNSSNQDATNWRTGWTSVGIADTANRNVNNGNNAMFDRGVVYINRFGEENAGVGYTPSPSANSAANRNITMLVGTTYLFVGKFTNLGSTQQEAKMWILNAANVTAIGLLSSPTDTNLNTNSIARATLASSLTMSSSFNTGNVVKLLTQGQDSLTYTDRFDELRFADTSSGNAIAQVMPVPEPTTIGLIGLAAVGLLSRRRRMA